MFPFGLTKNSHVYKSPHVSQKNSIKSSYLRKFLLFNKKTHFMTHVSSEILNNVSKRSATKLNHQNLRFLKSSIACQPILEILRYLYYNFNKKPKFVSIYETNSTHGVTSDINKNFPILFIQNHGNWPVSGETGEI